MSQNLLDEKFNELMDIASRGGVGKIQMSKDQHAVMEMLVAVYMSCAVDNNLEEIAILDGIWDSAIEII